MHQNGKEKKQMSNDDPAVRLPRTVYEAIVTHAREGKPEEVCGLLRGRGRTAFQAIRAVNVADERIENYAVDPQSLLLQFAFEEAGDELMGIYHSHPVSIAYPSATDAWNANYPDAIYLICSLEDDNAPVLRAFDLITHWVDVDIAGLRAALPFYETRPHLFAHYQPAEMPTPIALAGLAGRIPAPFYVDFMTDDAGEVVDARVVSVVEHQVRIA
jgi:proteasome lid subunit RPN8/RPN11